MNITWWHRFSAPTGVGRVDPPVEVAGMRVLRRDRLGGLIHEYAQVA
jgi:hypothetical protein